MIAALIIGAMGVAGAFAFNAATFLPLLMALVIAIPSIPASRRTATGPIHHEIREGLRFVWTRPGTRRLTIMGLVFMFLAAPLQGLLPVFAQRVLGGGPMLFG
ncbi:MAG: MFS transporter, partial [Tepidisphaerales bacterium]